MDQNPEDHSVRRFVPPGRRTSEVVRCSPQPPPPPPTPPCPQGLHVCPGCEAQLVQPLHWHQTNQGMWALTRACPNCQWREDGIVTQKQVDDFDRQLHAASMTMLDDLRRLTQANMAEEMDRFAAALRIDLILPEDF